MFFCLPGSSAGLEKENAEYISLLVVSGWWDITANSTTRTKTARWWLN